MEDKPATFHTPVPRVVMARIAEMTVQLGMRNRAEFLFEAVNAMSEKHGRKPLPQSVMQEFRPYEAAEQLPAK